jgi:hypothetical protein
MILRLEKSSDNSHSNRDREFRQKRLKHARILGYLIREGPSAKVKEHVAQEVMSRWNDGAI